jgi:hypothetical protein
LASTLRYLAGGSYLDIAFEFGMSPITFMHSVLWNTCNAIEVSLDIDFSLAPEDLHRSSEEFANYSNNRMKGCVMAIDGWVCVTRQPTKEEACGNVTAYRNRKHCWGIVCLAGCDARCRFTMFSCQNSGSTYDSTAWQFTSLRTALEEGKLHKDYYVIGDEAFVNTQQFLVPWGGRNLGIWKDSFNYHLSSMRQCIERAFGLLTQRWGIFWRPLNCRADKWPLICIVAAKLHNFCIDRKEMEVPSRWSADIQIGDRWQLVDNEDEEFGGSRPTGDTRRRITYQLELEGFLRPPHAQVNSRA